MKRTCAVYLRVSSDDDRQTVESQRGPVDEFLKRAGWSIHETYIDTISGSTDRRPGLDRLMNDAKQRWFNAVVVYKLDRLGRSLSHLVRVLDEFKSLEIDLVSVTQPIDTTTASGKLVLGILAVFSEFERDLITERIRTGVSRARKLGHRLGRPPRFLDPVRLRELKDQGRSLRAIGREFRVSVAVVKKSLAKLTDNDKNAGGGSVRLLP